MNPSRAVVLPDRAVIRVSGADSPRFLHGLVTQSVEALAPGEARFAALLTPQGKIIVDFFVVAVSPDEDGGFVLDAPRALAEDLVKRLLFYRLRSKVSIEPRPELAVAVSLDRSPPDDLGLVFTDPRNPGLGARIVLPAEGAAEALKAAGLNLVDEAVWHGRRISLGIPEGGKDFIYGDTFPHEADMDVLGGIDFQKGCFIGQEVVSRVERRGVARSRVVPVTFEEGAPEPGIEVQANGRPIGHMGSGAGRLGLALLRLDRADEAIQAGEKLVAGGIELRLVKPDWATFAWPGEADRTAS